MFVVCLLEELDGSAAEVLLAWRTQTLRLTVVGHRVQLLLEAVSPRVRPVGRGGPPARGLVGGLA
jgi:hypothetical protein